MFSSGFINHYKFLPLCYLNKNLFKTYFCSCNIFSKVVQSLSHVWLFVTPWTAAHQASLSFTISLCLFKLMSIELVMPSSFSSSVSPFPSCPQSPPASGSLPMSRLFRSDAQSIGASASTSVLPKHIQGWSPLGWTGLISLQSKGLSRVFSNTTVQKHQFFGAQLSLWSNSEKLFPVVIITTSLL